MEQPINKKRITRSDNKIIAGVLAGLGEYFNIDPVIVRVAFVLLSIFTAGFPGLLVYIILWIVMPEKK